MASCHYFIIILIVLITSSIVYITYSISDIADACYINIATRTDNIIVLESENYQTIYPAYEGQLLISKGKNILIASPGNKTISAKCGEKNKLISKGVVLDLDLQKFTTTYPAETRLVASYPFNKSLIEIGFLVNEVFVSKVLILWDSVNRIPLYSSNNITKWIGARYGNLEIDYAEDQEYYNLSFDIDEIYDIESQKETINSLLNLNETSTSFINENQYLFKTPLVSAETFVYRSEQLTTFHQINTIPVWKTIYEGKWKLLENSVTNYASSSQVDLQVFSGSYGIFSTYHSTYKLYADIYLHVDANDEKKFPVPLLLWKLVYDTKTLKASVFFVINDPFFQFSRYIICENISERYEWLDHLLTDFWGFYACSYEEAKERIPDFPQLNVGGVL